MHRASITCISEAQVALLFTLRLTLYITPVRSVSRSFADVRMERMIVAFHSACSFGLRTGAVAWARGAFGFLAVLAGAAKPRFDRATAAFATHSGVELRVGGVDDRALFGGLHEQGWLQIQTPSVACFDAKHHELAAWNALQLRQIKYSADFAARALRQLLQTGVETRTAPTRAWGQRKLECQPKSPEQDNSAFSTPRDSSSGMGAG
ncbi:unnamed protein product [Symbiodinium necroappetens]|uniref:Uncharacterized protein n=1 Tax=Symbiodinium necroappetens TaxID=1628268 RepID=A0A812WH13_9DINO|nr:unnamed protein product [Symbiodinium necroappetens]